MMKKLNIIVTYLKNIKAQLFGIVTNLQLTEKVPVMFYNSKSYDSHLIFCKLSKFDVKLT